MLDIDQVISDLDTQIRWIEDIECHQFPGWRNVVNAMTDATSLIMDLKRQAAIKQMIIEATEQEINRTKEQIVLLKMTMEEKNERKTGSEGSSKEDRGTGVVQQERRSNDQETVSGFRCHFLRRKRL